MKEIYNPLNSRLTNDDGCDCFDVSVSNNTTNFVNSILKDLIN